MELLCVLPCTQPSQQAELGQILAFIWLVIKRRLYPPTIEDIRDEIKRSEDVDMTALNITQLIEQHGSHGWTDALRQDFGPWLLLQLEDLANILEIWRKCVCHLLTSPRKASVLILSYSMLRSHHRSLQDVAYIV